MSTQLSTIESIMSPGFALRTGPANHVDFDGFCDLDSDWTDGPWRTDLDNSGTVTLLDEANGVARLACTVTANSGAMLQKKSETFLPATGRRVFFAASLRNNVGATMLTFAGLAASEASAHLLATGANASANHIGFEIIAGVLYAVNESSGTRTSTAISSTYFPADGAFYQLGFAVTDTGKVQFFVDGVLVATHATNIPATEMAPTFGAFHVAGSATARLDVDYFHVQQSI